MSLDPSKSLWQNLTATALAAAHRPALTFLDHGLRPTHYTYQQLFARTAELAGRRQRSRLPKGAVVGILLSSQQAQILHYLAALACDWVPAILTPPNRKLRRDYYLETTRAVLERCQFDALITDLDDLDTDTALLEPFTLRAMRSSPRRAPADLDSAFLQFSSGTTGIKRGVLVSDRAVIEQIRTYAAAIALTPRDRIASWLPLYHDMGFIAALHLTLAAGAHAILLHPLDWVANPGLYPRAVSQYRATLGWHPNFAFAFMAERVRECDLDGVDLSSLRGLVNCSEPVTHESQQRFLQRFEPYGLKPAVFWGCYAMAETVFALTHGRSHEPGGLDQQGPLDSLARRNTHPLVSVGRPLAGVELIVADEEGHPLGDRRLGELWVRSPFNLRGYYRNPEATRQAFQAGWYRTGDLGFRVGSRFFVCGRRKDLLIVAGVNVYPQDLEDTVSALAGVQPGRVAAFADFDSRTQTERVIVLAETALPAAAQQPLLVEIRQRILAGFQIANLCVELVPPGTLIKSSAGKMARRANREAWLQRQAGPALVPSGQAPPRRSKGDDQLRGPQPSVF